MHKSIKITTTNNKVFIWLGWFTPTAAVAVVVSQLNAKTSTFCRSEGREGWESMTWDMGIIQPCILGRSPAVRLVWMPGRGQGSPLICHRNCWCRTSRLSLAHPPHLYPSLFISRSAFTQARSTWLSASTMDPISQCCYGNQNSVLQYFSPVIVAWIWYLILQPQIPSHAASRGEIKLDIKNVTRSIKTF